MLLIYHYGVIAQHRHFSVLHYTNTWWASCVRNYRQLHCLLKSCSDWQQIKHKSFALLALGGKNPPVTCWFPSQRACIIMWKVFRCHNVMCCVQILLCFILLWVYQYPVFNLSDTSSYILQGCFIDIGEMKYLFRCQWSNPEDYG